MSQNITMGIKELVEKANDLVNNITVEEAKSILDNKEYIFVDVRDYRELIREGKIPGAISCPRGMLEFWIDPKSPYHKKIFDQNKTYVFYCASAWRSALATKSALEMGLNPVCHIKGGYNEWIKNGGRVESIKKL